MHPASSLLCMRMNVCATESILRHIRGPQKREGWKLYLSLNWIMQQIGDRMNLPKQTQLRHRSFILAEIHIYRLYVSTISSPIPLACIAIHHSQNPQKAHQTSFWTPVGRVSNAQNAFRTKIAANANIIILSPSFSQANPFIYPEIIHTGLLLAEKPASQRNGETIVTGRKYDYRYAPSIQTSTTKIKKQVNKRRISHPIPFSSSSSSGASKKKRGKLPSLRQAVHALMDDER
ncbi:hypothetical protein VTL71DRAFT_292 [Oculimacula yallundae]|uniref:Uncharacterized protein n=1 Tax=Oculimacula yallundae TaxID=86028 RepID=A0ABR4D1Z2_9HELO